MTTEVQDFLRRAILQGQWTMDADPVIRGASHPAYRIAMRPVRGSLYRGQFTLPRYPGASPDRTNLTASTKGEWGAMNGPTSRGCAAEGGPPG
jgi:hypothetical protein